MRRPGAVSGRGNRAVKFCPACGKENPEDARFCVECDTRLLGSARADLPRYGTEQPAEPVRQDRPKQPSRQGLGIASLVLGLLGLGLPAIAVGVYVVRKQLPGRFKALTGILLGSVSTLVLVVFLIGLVSRGCSPLHQHLTPATVERFAAAVMPRVDQLERRTDNLRQRLGPGAADELAQVYILLNTIRQDLDEMRVSLDEVEINETRDDVLAKLEQVKSLLPPD